MSNEEFASYVARRSAHERAPQIDFVRSDERSHRYARIIDAAMQPLVGKPLDTSSLERRITELYGLDLFETVDYRLVRDQEREGLEVSARRKSWGPNYVRFSLNLQDDFEGNNSYNAAARFIVTEVNELGAEWVTDLQVGENPLFRTELYQPLSYSPRYFIAPQLLLQVRTVQLLNGQVPLAEFRVRSQEAELAVGREFSSWGELRFGVRRGFRTIAGPYRRSLASRAGLRHGRVHHELQLRRARQPQLPAQWTDLRGAVDGRTRWTGR